MNWYLQVLQKYAVFNGRAQRKEYWFFTLFNVIFALILGFLDGLFGTLDAQTGVGILGAIYALAVLLPGLSVTIRRLHDTDRSGWWVFIILIPIIGALALLVFMVLDSIPNDNRFGSNPKEAVI